MDNSEEKPPRGILFVLEDGTEWAEMLPREEMKPRPTEELLDHVRAHVVIPPNPRLH